MPRPRRACSELGATQLDEVEVNARVRAVADDGRDRPLHGRAVRRPGCGIPRRARPALAGRERPHPHRTARPGGRARPHSRPTGSARACRCPASPPLRRVWSGAGRPGPRGSVAAVRARPPLGGVRGARAGAGIRRVGVRAGRERGARRCRAGVEPLQQAREGSAGARSGAPASPRRLAARTSRLGPVSGPAAAGRRRPERSSCSPEPALSGGPTPSGCAPRCARCSPRSR